MREKETETEGESEWNNDYCFCNNRNGHLVREGGISFAVELWYEEKGWYILIVPKFTANMYCICSGINTEFT